MSATTRDMHLAMGMPDPGTDETEAVDNPEEETAENDAIDAVFATDDPATRREAFRKAVELCTKGGY